MNFIAGVALIAFTIFMIAILLSMAISMIAYTKAAFYNLIKYDKLFSEDWSGDLFSITYALFIIMFDLFIIVLIGLVLSFCAYNVYLVFIKAFITHSLFGN